MLKEQFLPDQEKKIVISASSSKRRNAALRILPNLSVYDHPGPTAEIENSDQSLIAKDKCDYLVSLFRDFINLMNSREIDSQEKQEFLEQNSALVNTIFRVIAFGDSFQIIGGDTQTQIPIIDRRSPSDSGFFYQSFGKPEEEEEVREHFASMSRTQQAIYRVFSGSNISTYTAAHASPLEVRHMQKVVVYLRPEMVKHFSTHKGFNDYKAAFENFYQSPAYDQNNHEALTMKNISGGMSLPVFIQEKAVEAIEFNGQKVTLGEANKEFLKKIIYAVAVGYSPLVLDQITPGAYQFTLDNWSWLEEVVKQIKPHAKK